MSPNNQLALGILAHLSAALSKAKVYRSLPGFLRKATVKAWRLLSGNKLVGDVPFTFDAEVSGTKFQLCGPYRYMAYDYYGVYLAQGAYEADATAHINEVVRKCPAPRVLDIGAHYGWYTIYLAKFMANRGTVFAFEPSETVFSFLKRNVELNDLHNVRLYKVALSDKRETIRMIPAADFPGESRYMHSVKNQGTTDDHADVLSAVTFDELNEAESIHPNIVKIDVHGVWRKVIDGMRESLYREVEHLYLDLDTPSGEDLALYYADVHHVMSVLRDIGMDLYEIHGYAKHGSSEMIEADENRIVRKGNKTAMLYALKRGAANSEASGENLSNR